MSTITLQVSPRTLRWLHSAIATALAAERRADETTGPRDALGPRYSDYTRFLSSAEQVFRDGVLEDGDTVDLRR